MWVVAVGLAQVVNYDTVRVNNSETSITPANAWKLGIVGQYWLDGPIAAQPLYIAGSPNVLIVATMNNTVYGLNADSPGAAALWSTNFGATWAVGAGAFFNIFYSSNVGILSTPVSDGTYVYLVSVNNTPTYTLRKVNLSTGVQAASVAISGVVVGTGAGTVGGVTDDTTGANLNFHAAWELQRPALNITANKVYVGFGAAGDESQVWHGWIFSYNISDLSQAAVWCSAPDGNGAGIWESGGFAVDGSSNIYVVTGNGSWDGSSAFGQSVIKLNSSLVMQDWFTPSNHSSTDSVDADLSSGHVLLIPGTVYLTLGSKDGRVWLLDTTSMGHLQGTGTAPQVLSTASFTAGGATGIYGGIYFGGVGYFPLVGLQSYAFTFSSTAYNSTPAIGSGSYFQAAMAGSSNSGTNPILWAATPESGLAQRNRRNATLRALDPATMNELWASSSGTIGSHSKYVSPVVAGGRVYLATWEGAVVVFGPPPAAVSVTGILTAP